MFLLPHGSPGGLHAGTFVLDRCPVFGLRQAQPPHLISFLSLTNHQEANSDSLTTVPPDRLTLGLENSCRHWSNSHFYSGDV